MRIVESDAIPEDSVMFCSPSNEPETFFMSDEELARYLVGNNHVVLIKGLNPQVGEKGGKE